MRKKNREETPRDFRIAFRAAESFRGLSKPFLQKVGDDIETCHERAVQDIGGLISSATSMAFSVELYLKSLRALLQMHIPQRHDLWALYKDLPKEHKLSIDKVYVAIGDPAGLPVYALHLQLSVGRFKPDQMAAEEKEDAEKKYPKSINSLLKRNKDAFHNWRYLYEKGNAKRLTSFHYEFYHLAILTDVLHAHIQKNDPGNPQYDPVHTEGATEAGTKGGAPRSNNSTAVSVGLRARGIAP